MSEPTPPSDFYKERFGIHTELDQRKLAKEAGIVGHLPRNNEQALFLELTSRFNRPLDIRMTRTGVVDAVSYLRNIDYDVITHPYAPLLVFFTLGDIYDKNIALAKEMKGNHGLYSQLRDDEYRRVIGLLSDQSQEVQNRFKVSNEPNGLYYTANPQNRSKLPETPRISLSLSPKDGPEIAGEIVQAIFEYLKEFPDLYMQFKLFQSDPFGFGDDLHVYFNPDQEAHMYTLLDKHLYPSIRDRLLGGGRSLPLPVYGTDGYQMKGVQFGQPLPGLSTAQTMKRLMNVFLGYYEAHGKEGEMEDVLKAQGCNGLRNNPYYLGAVRQASMSLSKNGRKTDPNNILVPAQFQFRFPTFSAKTRFREMKALE